MPRRARDLGMTLDDLEQPRVETMAKLTGAALVDGSGAFAGGILEELRRRRLAIHVIGWDPYGDPDAERRASPASSAAVRAERRAGTMRG